MLSQLRLYEEDKRNKRDVQSNDTQRVSNDKSVNNNADNSALNVNKTVNAVQQQSPLENAVKDDKIQEIGKVNSNDDSDDKLADNNLINMNEDNEKDSNDANEAMNE